MRFDDIGLLNINNAELILSFDLFGKEYMRMNDDMFTFGVETAFTKLESSYVNIL